MTQGSIRFELTLRLPDSVQTYASLIEHLKFWQSTTGQDLRIVTYVSELEKSDLKESLTRRGFRVEDSGEILRVEAGYSKENEPISTTFYCYYDESRGIFLAFTSDPSEAISRTLGEWVKYQRKLYHLWVNPIYFTDVSNKVLNENPGTIIPAFNAKRYPWSKFDRVVRPEFERSFEYHGDDGRFALEEMSHFYGVLPTAIDFQVPRHARFRMTNDGLFTFKGGNLDFVFNIINEILSLVMREKRIMNEAKYEFIPVEGGTTGLQLVNLVPVSVEFGRAITYDESSDLMEALRKSDFEIYDVAREKGSLHLSGTIYDKQKRSTIDLTGTADRLTLSPHGDVKFDSFMRLYRVLSDTIDVEATMSPHLNAPQL
jgi:hypothetical protein